MRFSLSRCGKAVVAASVCIALFLAFVSFVFGVVGGLLNELSNALGILSNHLWNDSTGRPRWMR
jgi:hypothetical protein